jgi:hypothetical protein
MKEDTKKKEMECCKNKCTGGCVGGGAVYGLGFVGALIFYLQHAQTFMEGFIGFLKAIVWPAFVVYRVFELLKM